MTENRELIKIKKIYGEKFMRLCRKHFPTILEEEGKLLEILESSFANNTVTLYEDIIKYKREVEFKDYIYSKIDEENQKTEIVKKDNEDIRTPYEILDEVGYDLVECTTEEEVQKFRKYYEKGEELCTFDGGRLDTSVVFWAVKKDAENIKRKDFKKPEREDEYGTSVMSIQFFKFGKCMVSIKNRYNHAVINPDATYGNDLDKIAPGLTQSFERLLSKRGLKLDTSNKEKFKMPGYVVAPDGRYYKYNMEVNGKYYCPGNIVIEDGKISKLQNPEHEILIDYFLIDLKNKTIKTYGPEIQDSFVNDLQGIKQIHVTKDKKTGERNIIIEKKDKTLATIKIDKDNQIIGYQNDMIKEIENNFLMSNNSLAELDLPNLESVGNNFLKRNCRITNVNLTSIKYVGDFFLHYNEVIQETNFPQLKKVGIGFLENNLELKEANFPNLEYTDKNFLYRNQNISRANFAKLKQAGDNFLYLNHELQEANFPNLEYAGDGFLYLNHVLKKASFPNLKKFGVNFLRGNTKIRRKIIKEIERERVIKKILPKDIAILDKKNRLTVEDIKMAERVVKRIQEISEGLKGER